MTAVRITESPDLSPVFGELDDERARQVTTQLTAADEKIAGLADELNARGGVGFATEGVVLETEVSGQAMVKVLLENEKRNLTFAAEIRPGNFFGDEESPWQPGRPPMVMTHESWDVEGFVGVRFKTRVAGRPYTIQEQVAEIAEKRYVSVDAAVKAFVAACDKLVQLAGSREPTLPGWKPEIPESVGSARPIA